jgi:hypothetical protein
MRTSKLHKHFPPPQLAHHVANYAELGAPQFAHKVNILMNMDRHRADTRQHPSEAEDPIRYSDLC